MPDIYRLLGERVRAARKRLGWTQEELAERANLHFAYIGQIERADKKVSLAVAQRVSDALGVRLGELLDLESASGEPGWESRIRVLLQDKTPGEKAALYGLLRQMSRSWPARGRRTRKPGRAA